MRTFLKKAFIETVSFLVVNIPLPENVRGILMWPIASRVLGMSYSEPIQLKSGITIASHMEDQLGRLAIFYGKFHPYFWEPVTTRLLEKLLTDSKTALLAGSHIGLMALYARKAMPKEATVYTFEPISHLYEISKRNFELNPDTGAIVLEHNALGDKNSTVTMQSYNLRSKVIDTASGEKSDGNEQVGVTTIDTYCSQKNIQKLDLVLLDVEGYELNALKGMQQQLENNPPKNIIYEISFPNKGGLKAAEKIESYLEKFGYHFYIIEDLYDVSDLKRQTPQIELTPANPESYEAHRRHQYFNMYATLRKTENLNLL